MNKKRIVVTGIGLVSCFGNDPDVFFENLLEGKSGVKKIEKFPCEEYPTRIAATIDGFDPGEYVEKKLARRGDQCISYALVAGKKAVEDAGLDHDTINQEQKRRMGVIVGSGMGGMTVFQDGVKTIQEKGIKRLTPFFIPYVITNMSGALLALDLGFMGPNYSISTACATGNFSIVSAANHIHNGDADIMVCGGVEAPIVPIGLAGFCAIKALSQRNDEPKSASRPFDKSRDGFVMGEGAAILVLEDYEHAKKRGAKIYAEYLGGAVNCDAHHMTEPTPDGSGVASCIRSALKNSELDPADVDYINAHATSTPVGDIAEIKAINSVFEEPEKITVNATKSMIGHSLGAAGGFEAIVTVKTLEKGKVHPNINIDEPEEGMRFDISSRQVERPVTVGISNSFGFGGHNSVIAFKKFSDEA